MTIEQQALALVNEVRAEAGGGPVVPRNINPSALMALCRALERHEAFRQEVSEAATIWQKVFDYLTQPKQCPTVSTFMGEPVPQFSRFIIAPPPPVDPKLVALREAILSDADDEDVTRYEAALAKHGLAIRKEAVS